MAGPKRVVIVDDSPSFCSMWRRFFEERYDGKVAVESYLDPLQALKEIKPDIGLMVLDLEMPGMDGIKFLKYATAKGVDRRRVVISSGREADELHRFFPAGCCLAVINKDDPAQQAAFLMILESVMRKP